MGVKGKRARSLILLFIMKADHFLTVCLWLNNSAHSTIFTFLSRLLVPVFLLNNVSRQGLPTNLWCLGITSISSYTFIYRINFFIKPSVFYYDKLCKIYNQNLYLWFFFCIVDDQEFQNHVFVCKDMPARVGKNGSQTSPKRYDAAQLHGGSCCHFERFAQQDVLNPIN